MRSLFALFLTSVVLSVASSQSDQTLKAPSSFFPKQRTKVLVVGSVHLHYPGLDFKKTADADKIDVLTEPKRSELSELVEYIKRFKPTKIAIEAHDSWKAVEKLRQYKEGGHRDNRDERYQIAFRIADDLRLDTIYSVDASPFSNELSKIDSNVVKRLFDQYDFRSDDPYNRMAFEWIQYSDKAISRGTLLEFFKWLNSPESHQYGYGAYLTGDFKLGETQGADVLSVWWYNRNLRIFRKIQQIGASDQDRIMVLMGNGHAAVLRQLLEASPEYEFVEFGSLDSK